MASTTPRFGLNYFGGDIPGSLTDDGQKYTLGDRLLIDKLLAAIEAHNHHVTAVDSDLPTDAPTLTLHDDVGGTLEAGHTYYYEITFVDDNGLETPAGDEVSIDTPDLLDAPAAPSGESATGGSLPAGMYYYALTAIRGTEESTLGSAFTMTLLAGEGTATLTLPALGGADSLRVWRMGLNESYYTKIGTSSTGTFTDTGTVAADPCACDPDNQPPAANSGASIYSVTLALSTADAAIISAGHIKSWRIYRTETSGNYLASSLVHDTVETIDELDPDSGLVTTWIDDGDSLLPGQPPLNTQRLVFTPYSFETVTTFPTASDYPEGYPLIKDGALYVQIGGSWTTVGGGGGSFDLTTIPRGGFSSPWSGLAIPGDPTTGLSVVDLSGARESTAWYPTKPLTDIYPVVPDEIVTDFSGIFFYQMSVFFDVSGATAGDAINFGPTTMQHIITAAEISAGTLQLWSDFELLWDDPTGGSASLKVYCPSTTTITGCWWFSYAKQVGTRVNPVVDRILVGANATGSTGGAGTVTVTWDDTGTSPSGTPTSPITFRLYPAGGTPGATTTFAAWNAGTATFTGVANGLYSVSVDDDYSKHGFPITVVKVA
jgi:hypothetical protein